MGDYNKARSIRSLLGSYDKSIIKKATKLKFEGIDGYDVYNVTSPFMIKRTSYLLGRVEERNHEIGTKAMFFRNSKNSNNWILEKNLPMLDLQDPFIFEFREMNIFGGVQTKEVTARNGKKRIKYRNVFYSGKSFHVYRGFARGPWGMKGIKFIELSDGKIGVFTRPQGKKGRRGKIGFEIVDSVSKITPRRLSRAEILKNMFIRGEWGGVNQVHVLKNGKLGVLGHIARFSGKWNRFYYPMTFMFNPETNEFSGLKIIASRSDLPDGIPKRDDLYHVIYPGGIIRHEDGTASLYAGIGDAESCEVIMEDPFLEYEKEISEEK